MESRWSDAGARKFVAENAARWGEDLALRVYSARLLGEDPALVLHGGGNSSVKTSFRDLFGEETAGAFVKASGFDMASIGFEGFPGLALDQLKRLRRLSSLTDAEMEREVRRCLFDPHAATPSIEASVHAFIPAKFIDHTHADAILTLTNQKDGKRLTEEALGNDVIILDYVTPGFDLAKAAAEAFERHPGRAGMVWLKHGVVTWGESAQASYEAMIRLVTKAEDFAA
ncbi:MAG: class II aldolase/adducin family protein, partial [Acidobacteriota bacterium]|nr:class II aldolase/adducin family protein [Acidobacteriota bacterium]